MPPDGVEFRDADWRSAAAAASGGRAVKETVASIKARLTKGIAIEPEESCDCDDSASRCCSESTKKPTTCCATPSANELPSGPRFTPLGCKGISQALTVAAVARPVADEIVLPAFDAVALYVRPVVDEFILGTILETATPPPRV